MHFEEFTKKKESRINHMLINSIVS